LCTPAEKGQFTAEEEKLLLRALRGEQSVRAGRDEGKFFLFLPPLIEKWDEGMNGEGAE